MGNPFNLQYPVFVLPGGYTAVYAGVALIYLILALLFAFSPFFFVVKKWRPVTWWKMAFAIALTFFLYFYVVTITINDAVGIWLARYVQYAYLITQYLNLVYFVGVLVSLLLSISPFLSVRLIYGNYTWKRFFAALAFALVILALNIFYWYWTLMLGFQQLIERFN